MIARFDLGVGGFKIVFSCVVVLRIVVLIVNVSEDLSFFVSWLGFLLRFLFLCGFRFFCLVCIY